MAHIPMRMCISCRRMLPQNELMRIVRETETDEIKLDMDKRLMGRGAYICRSAECIEKAQKKNGLNRHFKCAVPGRIYDRLNQSLRETEKG